MKQYTEIRPEFTVDRFVDGAAPTANSNSFQRMINLIPKHGCMETRYGISELTHTPDTTGGGFHIDDRDPGDPIYVDGDPVDFAIIQAVFPFNTRATLGYNLLTGIEVYSASWSVAYSGGATCYTGDFKMGTGCFIATKVTATNTGAGNPARDYGMRTVDAFPSYMPGNSGGTTKSFMCMYWIKPLNCNAGANAEWHLCFGNRNDGKQSWSVRHFDTTLQAAYAGKSGASANQFTSGFNMVQGQWHFIAVWHDFVSGFKGGYLYNQTSGTEVWSASAAAPDPSQHYYTSSAYNSIPALQVWDAGATSFVSDASDAGQLLMDHLSFWSKPMHINNTSNVTLARLTMLIHL